MIYKKKKFKKEQSGSCQSYACLKDAMHVVMTLYSETANGSLNQLFISNPLFKWITVVILELIHAKNLILYRDVFIRFKTLTSKFFKEESLLRIALYVGDESFKYL
eukprot:30634_6